MRHTLFTLLLIATAPLSAQTPTASPTGEPLTLERAFAIALAQNPSVSRARIDMEVAEAARRGTLSAILPRVQITGAGIRNTEEVSFGEGADRRSILPENDWNYRLTVSQPIYAGNRERKAYEQSKIAIRNAAEGVRATEDAILLRVAADYLAVVQGDELIKVEQANVALAERRLQQAQDFFSAGEVTRLDVIRGEAAVKAAQRRLAGAVQNRETAAGRLRIDLNLDQPIATVEPTLDVQTVGAEGELIAQAAANRPDVRQAENNIKVAQLEVQKQRGAYLPTVSADASYIQQKSTFPTDSYGQGAIRFTIPVWQSGEIGARVSVARSREEQARLVLAELQQGVREDVRKALLDLRTAETTLGLAQEQLAAAQAEYEQTFESYRAQEATSLDLQSAESNLADSRRAVATSGLDLELARLRVAYVTGNLKATVITEATE